MASYLGFTITFPQYYFTFFSSSKKEKGRIRGAAHILLYSFLYITKGGWEKVHVQTKGFCLLLILHLHNSNL